MSPQINMRKDELEKNRLELAYTRNLQLMNVVLLTGAGSFVAYLAGLILNPDKFKEYSILLAVIGFFTYYLYLKIDKRFRDISDRIRQL